MIKRLWGIRHVRWAWGMWQVQRFVWRMASIGWGNGIPNEHDLMVLDKIWRGER